MILFGYAVTRPIRLGKWALIGVVVFALFYLGVITILNLVAVGYENVQITLNSYNSSLFLWYQHIIPAGWVPQTTTCNPAVLAVNQVIATHGLFNYVIQQIITGAQSAPTLSYEGDPVQNCTIQGLSLQFSPVGAEVSANVVCIIRGSELYFGFLFSSQSLEQGNQGPQFIHSDIPPVAQLLNITQVLDLYTVLVSQLLVQFVLGYSNMDISTPSSFNSSLMCIFDYSVNVPGLFSTSVLVVDANYNEVLQVNFDSTGHLINYTIADYFLFNGTHNLRDASHLLGVVYSTGQLNQPYRGEGFWTALNWIFSVLYWLTLYDCGQLSDPNLPDVGSIFANNTLLQSSASIVSEFVLPYFQLDQFPFTNMTALPLDDSNRLEPVATPLQQTYTCTQRQLKGWLTVTIFVIVADYTLALGAYNLFILIAGWWQKRKDNVEANRSRQNEIELEEGVPLTTGYDSREVEGLQQRNVNDGEIKDTAEVREEAVESGGDSSDPLLVKLAHDDDRQSHHALQGHPTAVGS